MCRGRSRCAAGRVAVALKPDRLPAMRSPSMLVHLHKRTERSSSRRCVSLKLNASDDCDGRELAGRAAKEWRSDGNLEDIAGRRQHSHEPYPHPAQAGAECEHRASRISASANQSGRGDPSHQHRRRHQRRGGLTRIWAAAERSAGKTQYDANPRTACRARHRLGGVRGHALITGASAAEL